MRSIPFAVFVAVMLVPIFAASAEACRCEPVEPWDPDVETAREAADYIFFGRAVSRAGFEDEVPAGYRSWTFDVAAVWKGPVSRKGRVFAHAESNVVTSCDRAFEIGVAYVVFAYLEPDSRSARYRAGRCSLTAEIGETKSFSHEIVRRLGAPLSQSLESSVPDEPTTPTTPNKESKSSPKIKLHTK